MSLVYFGSVPGNTVKKSLLIGLAASLLSLLLAGCSTRTAFTNHTVSDEAAFAGKTTYRWQTMSSLNTSGAQANQRRYSDFDMLIQQTIDSVLLEKGYQRTKSEDADMIIDYRVLSTLETAASDTANPNYGPRWTFGDGSMPSYQGVSTPAEKTLFYTRGRLDVAAFSPDGKLLWHRSAERLLKEDAPVPERQQVLKESLQKLLKRFPEATAESIETGSKPGSRWCFLPWICP